MIDPKAISPLAALALAACSGEPAAKKADALPLPAPFNASFVPPAEGHGNFEMCLKNDAAENGLTKVTIPANVVFQSWGQLIKDLREPLNNDMRATAGDMRDPAVAELSSFAVITTQPVTLDSRKPCARTTVRAATNDGFRWTHDLALANKHYLFEPYPTVIKGRTILAQQWGSSTTREIGEPSYGGPTGEAIQNEEVQGFLLADAGNPVRLDQAR